MPSTAVAWISRFVEHVLCEQSVEEAPIEVRRCCHGVLTQPEEHYRPPEAPAMGRSGSGFHSYAVIPSCSSAVTK